MQAPAGLQRHIPKGSFLWEQIHPKDKDGLPARSPSGKYHVRCFVLDKWRRVTVDDRIPVDLFGRPLPVGIIPLQLWPLLLSKAVLKLMAAYQARSHEAWLHTFHALVMAASAARGRLAWDEPHTSSGWFCQAACFAWGLPAGFCQRQNSNSTDSATHVVMPSSLPFFDIKSL